MAKDLSLFSFFIFIIIIIIIITIIIIIIVMADGSWLMARFQSPGARTTVKLFAGTHVFISRDYYNYQIEEENRNRYRYTKKNR